MPVSDRRPLGGVSQFLSQFGFWAEPLAQPLILQMRRDVRVVEGARLESVCRGNSTVGSNPTLSASFFMSFFPAFSPIYARARFSPPLRNFHGHIRGKSLVDFSRSHRVTRPSAI